MPWRRACRPHLHREAAIPAGQISSGGRQQADGRVPRHEYSAPKAAAKECIPQA
jgi:hypothetical protein